MQKHKREEEAFRAVRLRPATLEDEPFLVNLFAATRSDELALMNCDENQKETFIMLQFKAQSRQYEVNYPHANNSIILFADALVGRMIVARTEAAILLVDISLLAEYRNAGIGTRLIQNLLKEAAVAGRPVRLHVFSSSPAVRLYERLGFSRIGDEGTYLEMMWTPAVSHSC